MTARSPDAARKHGSAARNRNAERIARNQRDEVVRAARANHEHLIAAMRADDIPDDLPTIVELRAAHRHLDALGAVRALLTLAVPMPPGTSVERVLPDGTWRRIPHVLAVRWNLEDTPDLRTATIETLERIPAGGYLSALTLAVERLPDRSTRPLLSTSTRGARHVERDYLPDLGIGPRPGDQAALPFVEQRGRPALYGGLAAYDAAGGATWKRGRGAPLDLGLWIESLLWLPHGQERAVIEPTLREVVDALWPNGWRRNRDLPVLARALVEVRNYEIPHRGGLWQPVNVRWRPEHSADLDAPVPIEVWLPAAARRATVIDRPTLRRLRLRSAAAYRAYLSLAALWDHHGQRGGRSMRLVPEVERDADGLILGADGRPLRHPSGAPVTRWSDRRAVRTGRRVEPGWRMPALSLDDLRAATFGDPARSRVVPDSTLRSQRQRAHQAIDDMAADGVIDLIEDSPRRWRIYRRDLE